MERLIDANKLVQSIGNNLGEWILTATAVKIIEEQPPVDAVKVVRCGKCKWYDPESECCQFWHGVRHPGHYCGEGERKDNA